MRWNRYSGAGGASTGWLRTTASAFVGRKPDAASSRVRRIFAYYFTTTYP